MMYNNNKFSVVTPNFNMARFLPETIESVLSNLQPDDEYFVIDGGSKDESVEIIRRYEHRLSGWVSEPDQGYADALAKGFRHCHGDFLCWINSGDLLLSGALQSAREVLSEQKADLIFGDDIFINDKGQVISHSYGHVHSLKNMMMYGGWTPLQDACYWRRDLYVSLGGINPNLKYAADYDFFLRASIIGRCSYVPIIFSAFRQHDGQKSVVSAKQYEIERHNCRKRVLKQQAIPVVHQIAAELCYRILARWRHHIILRLHRQAIQIGTPVATVHVRHLK